MIFALALVAAGVWLLAGPQLVELSRDIAATAVEAAPRFDRRHVAGAALVAAAALAWSSSRQAAPGPTPAPTPVPDAGIVLRGKFVGPTAAADAATAAGLFAEIADELEWDGATEQRYKTGVAFDDLRQRAREMRCRGVALGDVHPRARDAIKAYLDAAAGDAGGPLTPEQRSAWVAAYREIARAAADVAR